jgi:hypothetical protein
MDIKAGSETIKASAVRSEDGGIRVVLDGGVTDAQLLALHGGRLDIGDGYSVYEGYTRLAEHSVLLEDPERGEAEDMRAALEILGVKKGKNWTEAAKEARR